MVSGNHVSHIYISTGEPSQFQTVFDNTHNVAQAMAFAEFSITRENMILYIFHDVEVQLLHDGYKIDCLLVDRYDIKPTIEVQV